MTTPCPPASASPLRQTIEQASTLQSDERRQALKHGASGWWDSPHQSLSQLIAAVIGHEIEKRYQLVVTHWLVSYRVARDARVNGL
jgi:hypothetical protein